MKFKLFNVYYYNIKVELIFDLKSAHYEYNQIIILYNILV